MARTVCISEIGVLLTTKLLLVDVCNFQNQELLHKNKEHPEFTRIYPQDYFLPGDLVMLADGAYNYRASGDSGKVTGLAYLLQASITINRATPGGSV